MKNKILSIIKILSIRQKLYLIILPFGTYLRLINNLRNDAIYSDNSLNPSEFFNIGLTDYSINDILKEFFTDPLLLILWIVAFIIIIIAYKIGFKMRPTVPAKRGARWTNNPKRKIAKTPGEIKPWNSCIKVKIPPNFGLSSLGAIKIAINTNRTVKTRPVVTSSN